MENKITKTEYADAYTLKSSLERILGRNTWLALKDTTSIKTWQRELLKVINASQKSIEFTIEIADDSWIYEAKRILEEGKGRVQRSTNIVDMLSGFSATYMELSFHQVGVLPLNIRAKNVPLTKSNWKLSQFRSVQYVQTETQKLYIEFINDDRNIHQKLEDEKYTPLRAMRKK